ESARAVAADSGGGQLGEEVANFVKDAAVSGGIAARCPANWRLVDDDDAIEQILAVDLAMRARPLLGPKPMSKQRAAQDVIDERAFAGAAHARYASQGAE